MESSLCFMCGQKSESIHCISSTEDEPELSISYIICQHFWFQQDALLTAVICVSCWQKVDQFHRFFEEVKQHHALLLELNTISIKQEELESIVKVEQTEVEKELPFAEDSIVKIAEECNQESSEADLAVKKPAKKTNRKKVCLAKQKQREEDLIRQHLPYNCVECPETFETFLSMRLHMNSAHRKPGIMCCGVQYSNQRLIFRHVKAVLIPKAFKCDVCAKSYNTSPGFTRHMRQCCSRRFTCDQCSEHFPSQFKLNCHMASHEQLKKEKPKCEICGRIFQREISLREHMDAVHEKKAVFACDMCPKSFTRRWARREHRMTHDFTAEELRKQCPVCKKWQKNERLWKVHMIRHDVGDSLKCGQCDHVSVNSYALKQHVKRKHQEKLNNYGCDLCGKVYGYAMGLKEHIAIVHTKKPLFKCQFCERQFFASARMYTHRKQAHPKEWQEYKNTKFGIEAAEAQNEVSI